MSSLLTASLTLSISWVVAAATRNTDAIAPSRTASHLMMRPDIDAAAFVFPGSACCRRHQRNVADTLVVRTRIPLPLSLLPAAHPPARTSTTALSVSQAPRTPSSSTSHSDNPDPRTDIKSYLTQRSLQSLIYLLTMTHDNISADWIEEFLDTSNQLDYHGTGAAYLQRFGTWEHILLEMIESPVSVKRIGLGPKYRGGSGAAGEGRRQANNYLNNLSNASASPSSEGKGPTSLSSPSPPSSSSSPSPSASSSPRSFSSFSYLESISSTTSRSESDRSINKKSSNDMSNGAASGGSSKPSGQSKRVPGRNSYLDNISSDTENEETAKTMVTEGATSSMSIDPESFHRALLSARLDMESKNMLKASPNRSTATVPSTKSIANNEINRMQHNEALHRSLLKRRVDMANLARRKKSQAQETFHRTLLSIRLDLQRRDSDRAKLQRLLEAELAREAQSEIDRRTLARDKRRAEIDRRRLAEDRERSLAQHEESNPHISSDDDEYYMDLEIDPASLANRLLAVREQIALEFVEDLTLIFQADKRLIADMISASSKKEMGDKTSDVETSLAKGDFGRTDSKYDEEETLGLVSSNAVRMHQEKLSYLATGKASSPFRKGNFDLLYNLVTQASVHRLLRQLMADECNIAYPADCARSDKAAVRVHKDASFAWLRDFYVDRVSSYFDGDVKFGRADAFFEEWLRQNPVRLSDSAMSSSSSPSLPTSSELDHVDPLRLAEEMVRIRSDIVMEWRRSMRMVPEEDHGWLKLVIMERRMKGDENNGSKDEDDFGMNGFQ